MLSVRILVALALSLATLPFLVTAAEAVGPTVIDIDGNQANDTGQTDDWQSWAGFPNGNLAEGFSVIKDGVGNGDDTGIDGQEDYNDGVGTEQDWVPNKATASGKSDIGNVLVDSFRDGATPAHLWAAVGFDRGNGSGTQRYYLEFNQAEHDSIMPTRTVGDLRVILAVNGKDLEECQGAQLWTGSQWGTVQTCGGRIVFAVNNAPIDDYFGSPYLIDGKIPTNQFFEVGIDLTGLGATSCPVAGFRTFDMRTQEGNENGQNGQLKDVIRGPIDIPSDCGTLKIIKNDASTGAPVTVAGTKFSITPDPTAGSGSSTTKYVYDNNVGQQAGDLTDNDPATGKITVSNVDPDTYTVREITPPTGYFLPPPASDYTNCPTTPGKDCLKLVITAPTGGSNVATFTFSDEKIWLAPSIFKTAHGAYDSGYAWTIRKTVAPEGEAPAADDESTPNVDESGRATQTVPEGSPATFDYQVTVTGTESKSGWRVTGNVRVVNPNAAAMTVTLDDAIENGNNDITCSFDADDGGSYVVQVEPSDMSAQTPGTLYAYTCAGLTKAQADAVTTNRATVTWNLTDYPQTEAQAWASSPGTDSASATAGFAFDPPPASETNKKVVVSDDYNGAGEFGGPKTITYGENPANFVNGKYVVSFPYSVTFTDNPPHTCTDYDNTAEVRTWLSAASTAAAGDLLDSDDAVATVCVGSDLSVSKNAVLSFTRTYPFSIDKSVAVDTAPGKLPRVDVDPTTGKATVPYEVVVTDGSCEKVGGASPCDSGWVMTGEITVSNPNDFQDVEVKTIVDNYTGSFDTCTVTGTTGSGALLIPAGGSKKYGYTCSFSAQPVYDGTNTASITWDKGLYTTPTGADSFGFVLDPASPDYDEIVTIFEVDKTVNVIDLLTAKNGAPIVDSPKDLGNVTWQSSGFQHPAFTYSRDLEGTVGECVTYDNRASVMTIPNQGNPAELAHDTATVQVCWPGDLTVTKDGAGTFSRRYDWSVQKSILVGPEGNQVEMDAQQVKLDDPTLAHSFEYRVKAIPLPLAADADSGWAVTGTITVTNPNSADVAKATEVTITEQPDMGLGASCDVVDGDYKTEDGADVTVNDNKVSLPAEDAVKVNYTCSFISAPKGTQQDMYAGNSNQAKITWDGGEETTPKTDVAFTLPEENKTDWSVEVHDSQKNPTLLGVVDYNDTDAARTFEYAVTHTGTAGECETFPNTATIQHVTATSFLLAVAQPIASDTTNAEVCVQKPLLIANAVKTSFDRLYKWHIDKVADKHSVEVSGNGTAPFEYTVTVGPDTTVSNGLGYVDSGWTMTGTITVTNPNGADIGSLAAMVSDLTNVGGGAVCKVEGEALHAVTVPIGAEGVVLDYACTFASKPAYTGTNTATVTWNLASGAETHSDATATVGFENPADTAKASPRETDRVIDVTDAFDGGAGVPVVGLQDLDWVTVKALSGSVKSVKYTRNLGAGPGSCRTYPNVVRMFRDGTTTQVGLPADESVTVCSQVGPTLSNTAGGSYDRSYAWDIAKAADGTTFATGDDGTARVNYTVNATPGAATDSGWTMGGSLQVSNPNSYKSLSLGISIGTNVGGGAACSLTPGQDLVVPASGSRTYSYSCTFTGQPAYSGTATGTVSWGGGTAGTDAPVAFTLDTETNRFVDVVDDKTVAGQSVDLGTAEWNDTGTPATFGYSLDLAAEANQCEDYTNTATIVQTAQTADATVTVCGPEVLPAEEVAPRPPVVKGVETVLPSTGGPQLGLAWVGLGMLLAGGALLGTRRWRRSES